MRALSFSTAIVASLALASPALAQSQQGSQSQAQGQSTTGVGAPADALKRLPEQCQKAAQSTPQGQLVMNMPMMQGTMPPVHNMPMAANLPQANQDYIDAMRNNHGPMMLGMTIGDPDLAFLCGMIAHHQGAVDIAEVAQRYAKDKDVKEEAQKVIREQKKDIQELTELVKKHGK